MGGDAFRYDGKRVVVVGGATGMGAATAALATDLGADVVVLDVADVTVPTSQSIKVDLRDQASVDAAIEQIDAPVHALFCCAGVADGTPGIMAINFISQRHIFDSLVTKGVIARGAAAVMVSSVAGLGWMTNLEQVQEFLATPDWDTAAAWVDEHEGTDSYGFSKQSINCYVSQEAFPLLRQGIRLNAILPGPTDTPLARANADIWLGFAADYRQAANVPTLVPEQMASVMAFLCSDAASGITGIPLLVDQGHVSSALTDSFEAPMVKMILGLIEPSF